MVVQKLYYIQNAGFCGNALFWWRADRRGYTVDIREAGKFTEADAKLICKRESDTAWSVEYIDGAISAHKLIIDIQGIDNKRKEKF